jgi:hypothetical protein
MFTEAKDIAATRHRDGAGLGRKRALLGPFYRIAKNDLIDFAPARSLARLGRASHCPRQPQPRAPPLAFAASPADAMPGRAKETGRSFFGGSRRSIIMRAAVMSPFLAAGDNGAHDLLGVTLHQSFRKQRRFMPPDGGKGA